MLKRSDICIFAFPEGEERETVSDAIFEELMAHNFQKINEKHLTTNSRNFTNPKGDK